MAEWLPSEIDGERVARMGLFTAVDIKPGQVITTYAGITEYSHTNEVGTPKADYMMTLMPAGHDGMALVINGLRAPMKGYGLGSFCNDRRVPGLNNARKVTVSAIGPRGRDRHMGIFIESKPTKTILAHSEITINYGRGYFREPLPMSPRTNAPTRTPGKRNAKRRNPRQAK